MNFDDKEKEHLDFEQLNIKSHLNTSMELKGISVSEDLINRTLKAINNQTLEKQEQPPLNTQQAELRKSFSINKFVRGFAGVAAAAIIVVAGTQLLNGSMGSKKDSGAEMNSTAMDQEFSAESDGYNIYALTGETATETEEPEINEDDKLEESKIISDAGVQFDETKVGALAPEKTSDTTDFTTGTSLTSPEGAILSFTQLFAPELTGTAAIVVTKVEDDTTVTLTDQKEIEEFYLSMEKHQFTAATTTPSNVIFQMELTNTEQNQTYKISVGEHLQIEYSDTQTTSMSTYDVVDQDGFQQDLKNLFIKYSN